MTEEKGNTTQVTFTSLTPYPADTAIDGAIGELWSRFNHEYGTFKVTIEFYPDNADSEVEDE